jgi:hypothetical protein
MEKDICPDIIVHYYEASQGPLRSLSDLGIEEAETILQRIRQEGLIFASKRNEGYLKIRRSLEELIRHRLIQKGGQPKNTHRIILS